MRLARLQIWKYWRRLAWSRRKASACSSNARTDDALRCDAQVSQNQLPCGYDTRMGRRQCMW